MYFVDVTMVRSVAVWGLFLPAGHSAQYILKKTWRLDAAQYCNPCVLIIVCHMSSIIPLMRYVQFLTHQAMLWNCVFHDMFATAWLLTELIR